MHWQVAEAKQRFSEVLRAVRTGEPQTITHHGREVAVVVDIDQWHRLTVTPVDLTAVLTGPPHLDAAADVLEAVAGERRAADHRE